MLKKNTLDTWDKTQKNADEVEGYPYHAPEILSPVNHLEPIECYRAFSLSETLKQARGNGSIYDNETLYKAFKVNLDIRPSYTTIKRYWSMLVENNCVEYVGSSLQLKNRYQIAKNLGLDIDHLFFNQKIREYDLTSMTIAESGQIIMQTLTLYRLQQQEYNKRDAVVAFELMSNKRNDRKALKRLARKAEQNGESTESYINRLAKNKDVVTGCYYLGGLLGVSNRTANKVINGLVSNQKIKRTVVKRYVNLPVNANNYLKLDAMYSPKGYLVLPPKRSLNYFMLIKGSIIELMESKPPVINNMEELK